VPVAADVEQAREATVREHIEAERRGDFDAALATFARPRYEFPGDEVFAGSEAVAEMYRELATGFPDLSFPEIEAGSLIHHGDSVIGETRMMGTHEGSFRGLPPTGRRIDVPMVVIFDFEGPDLVCERVYFDRLTLFVQLGVARDPNTRAGRITTLLNHPLTLARGALRSVRS
jgi:predicted ester cyclase